MSGEIEKPLAIASAQGHVLALYGYSALYSYSALYGLDSFFIPLSIGLTAYCECIYCECMYAYACLPAI